MARKATTTTKTPVDNTPVDAKRISAIAKALYDTCAEVNGELMAQNDAKDLLDQAKEVTTGKREKIMLAAAALSHKGDWTTKEIGLAATDAGKMHNDLNTKKALETFIGEVKHAAHPLVREHIGALVSIRNAAWDEETAQLDLDKAFPAPMRKCFKRRYHALVGAMIATEKGSNFHTTEDLVSYARANDPSDNARAVFKRIEAMVAELQGMHMKFPADDLGHAAEILSKLTWNELAAAQMERSEALNPSTPAATTTATTVVGDLANTTVVETANPASVFQSPAKVINLPTKTSATNTTSPKVTPAADIVDELLGDNLQLAQS